MKLECDPICGIDQVIINEQFTLLTDGNGIFTYGNIGFVQAKSQNDNQVSE
jgi:hypothetical protein